MMTQTDGNQTRMQESSSANAIPEGGGERDDDSVVWSAIEQSFDLLDDGQYEAARALISTKLESYPSDERLELQLAWHFFHDPVHQEAGIERIRSLHEQNPSSVRYLDAYLAMLRVAGELYGAVQSIKNLSSEMTKPKDIAQEIENIYRQLGWKFTRSIARQNSVRSAKTRVLFWLSLTYWITGGPFHRLRIRGARMERDIEDTWFRWRRNLQHLPTELTCSSARTQVSREVDLYQARWSRIVLLENRADRLMRKSARLIVPVIAVVIILNEYYIKTTAVWSAVFLGVVSGLLGVAIAGVIEHLLSFVSSRGTRIVAGLGCWLVIVIGYFTTDSRLLSQPMWLRVLPSSLLFIAILAPIVYVFANWPDSLYGVRLARLRRRYTRGCIVDALLDVLQGLHRLSLAPSDLSKRAQMVDAIQIASSEIERNLPRYFGIRDPITAKWTSNRAHGAATALRHLLREVVAARQGSADRVYKHISSTIAAISMGELGSLRWTPPSAVPRESRRETVSRILRAVALMLLPGAFFFLLPPFLDLPGDLLAWGRIISVGWIVLYLAILLDPGLKEKIELARNLSELAKAPKPDLSSTSDPERRRTQVP